MSTLEYIEIPGHILDIIGDNPVMAYTFRHGVHCTKGAPTTADASAARIVFVTHTHRDAMDLHQMYPDDARSSDWWLDEFEKVAAVTPARTAVDMIRAEAAAQARSATPLLDALREQEARVTA
jgi:hypothetical protein